ncbi:ABC transporter permease [Vallitalea okinawensis]|uniref:ABC transporter permease n=1 Tax=Vallitalea okinawensis TaxID=2078660 RepID=UPI000CFC5261|nr:ABC transporter permease [Vallitalea okinawensis]
MLKLVKRSDMNTKRAFIIRASAVFLALIISACFILLLGHNPLEVYIALIDGAFGSWYRIQDTITIAIPLIITSLGILIAFKMKFWNIGAEGQICMGAFLASYFALSFNHLPKPLLLLIMFFGGIIGGGLWALIPAYLKVRFGTNETIITLMLNYIAIKWVTYLQYGPWKDPDSMGFPKIADFTDNALLPEVFGIHIGWIIAIALVIIVYLFIHHTKMGYEVSVVGESQDTARYGGINVKQIILKALFISGGLCGIVGMIQASGVDGTLSVDITSGYGYTAIITTWLSGLNSAVIIPVCVLFAALTKGSSFIQISFMIPQSAAEILQSMILFFVLGSELFIRYRIERRKAKKEVY